MNDNFLEKEIEEEKKQKKDKHPILVALIVIFFILNLIVIGLIRLNSGSGSMTMDKPIIYLYPTQEQEIKVSLGYPQNITSSYPKYTTSWDVIAKPNGDLKYLETNQNLYSLYYESENTIKFKVEKEGFCIKGKYTATFLEDALSKLGLTERESEEFIIYWLPRLEKNNYNYIRFATIDEINQNMPLDISPKPDTTIRVLMTFKALNEPIKVENQILNTPSRDGFVAVEWGGTELR